MDKKKDSSEISIHHEKTSLRKRNVKSYGATSEREKQKPKKQHGRKSANGGRF